MNTWTIQKLLNWTTQYFTDKGIDAPRLSAEMVLAHVLSLKRIELYTNFDQVVAEEQLARLRELVKRAGEHEPVAYLVGRTEFYSLEIAVTPDCLIPRPETELLVERAIEFLRKRGGAQKVCDLCTGSGCIAAAIARNCPEVQIIATDVSSEALAAAAVNVEKHSVEDRVTLLQGDLFDPVVPALNGSRFDLIVSNPPYVSDVEYARLDRNIREYEPAGALLGGADGLDVYRRIAEQSPEAISPGGALMLETGYAQGQAVRGLLEQTGDFADINVEKDSQDNDRVVTAIRTSAGARQEL